MSDHSDPPDKVAASPGRQTKPGPKTKQKRNQSRRRIGRKVKSHSVSSEQSGSAGSSGISGVSAVPASTAETTNLGVMSEAIVDQHVTDSDYCVSHTGTDVSFVSDDTFDNTLDSSGSSSISVGEEDLSSYIDCTSQFSSSSAATSKGSGEKVKQKRKSKRLTVRAQKKRVTESLPAQSSGISGEVVAACEETGKDQTISGELSSNTAGQPEDVNVPSNPSGKEVIDSTDGIVELQGTIDEDTVNAIVKELRQSIREDCFVRKERGSIQIGKLSNSHNASVERSVFWDCGSVRLYIHNFLVPKYHFIYEEVDYPQEITVETLCQYLVCLLEKISEFYVCKGIKLHQCLWDSSKGHMDSILFEDTPCFRDLNCNLIVKREGIRCSPCGALRRGFRRKLIIMEENADKDSSKIPHKHLDKKDLQRKLRERKKESKKNKRAIRRLKMRLKDKEGYFKLEPGFQQDFLTVLKNNEHKMTPAQKIFWQSQMNALKMSNKKSVRWHPMMIKIALKLQEVTTNTGYETFKEFVALPSSRRLYDYSHVIKAKEGCQQEILKDIKKKITQAGSEEHLKYVNLMCDEIHIRSGLVVRRSTGELIGYENLSDVEIELEKLNHASASKEYRPQLAKKALVFLVKGITSPVHNVVAVFSVHELTAAHMFDRSWDVIYNLEDADIKVLTMTFDGAATNRKFVEMHKPYRNAANTHCTLNLVASEERPLFFILDPPHLMKTSRNCAANSFAHKKVRFLWKNGQYLSWQVVEALYDLTSNSRFKEHKLTKAHIKLTAFSCMKVSLATQFFSASVANSLKRYKNHDKFKDHKMDELIKLIELMNKFFDCMNAKEDPEEKGKREEEETNSEDGLTLHPKKQAYYEMDDERFSFLTNDFLKFFDDWKDDVRKTSFSAKVKAKMMFSHQTIQGLKITVDSFIAAVRFMLGIGAPKVNGRVFNQDPVEQFFSWLRQSVGSDDNPSLKQVLDLSVRRHVTGNIGYVSSKGNTEVEKRKSEVDDTPLPALKRRKT